MGILRIAAFLFAAVTLVFAAAPVIPAGGVVNGADYTATFSPGILFSVFGTDLAAATKKAAGFPLPDTIDGVSVEIIDGTKTLKAPLFFVSAGQINAVLPYEITGTSVQVRVRTSQGVSAAETISITTRTPRLLTKTMNGKGEAILTHADYTVVSEQNPAKAGEVLVLYLAGLGAVSPAVASGRAAGDGGAGGPLNQVQDPVIVKVNGVSSTVYYKGLAPYFAGLYQINFKVPEETPQGPASISVECGVEISQAAVTFPNAIRWEPLGSGTIPAQGGSVTGSGMTVTVPSGSFASSRELRIYRAVAGVPQGAGRSVEVYGLSGLPSTFSGPVKVSVDIPGASTVQGQAYLMVREPGSSGGVGYIKATVQGDRVSADIPARPSASPKTIALARQNADSDELAEVFILSIILGTNEVLSEGAQFKMIYKAEQVSKTYADAFSKALDTAYSSLKAQGLAWTYGWPVEVHLKASGTFSWKWCTGQVTGALSGAALGSPFVLEIDEWLVSANAEYARQDKAFHLVAHLIQSQYGPTVSPAHPNAWLWLDEAVAVASERATGSVDDDRALMLPWYAPKGLESVAESSSAEEMYIHGRSASGFILFVMNKLKASDPTWLAKVYNRRKGASVPPLPAAAMQDARIDVDQLWLSYCRERDDRLFNPPYSGEPVRSDNFSGRTQELEGTVNKPVTFSWTAPDLAAQQFKLNLPATWPAEAQLVVNLSGPLYAEMALYRWDNGILRPVYTRLDRGTSVTIAAPETAFPGKQYALVLAVYNPRAVRPFAGPSFITITAKLVGKSSFDLLKALQGAPYVTTRLSANAKCNIHNYDYTQKPPKLVSTSTSACSPWFFSNFLNNKLYEPTWDGLTFSVDGTSVTGDATYQRTVQVKLKATYNPDDKSLRDGVMSMITTNKSLSVTPNSTGIETSSFKFSRIPLPAQDHENLTGPWMFQQVVASLPQTVITEVKYLQAQDGLTMEELASIDYLFANTWVSFKTQP